MGGHFASKARHGGSRRGYRQLLLTVGCSSSNSSSGSTSGNTGSGTNWATASSIAAGGGMNALVAAARKEGTLNVITLPANWANYGTIMKDFTAKYGIKINDANPDGSSQDELNAINQLKGANGGSLDNITPGVSYFKKLHSVGNFVPVTASAATMESGQTPIIVWWDYLLASEIGPSVKGLKIVIPSDASYAAYYDQAISKSAPHPAAARLWEEYLYSTAGQNLWLQGEARPIGAAGRGGEHRRAAVVQRDRLAVAGTVQAPGSVAGPGAPGSGAEAAPGPPARFTVPKLPRGLRRVAGVIPFGVYVTLHCLRAAGRRGDTGLVDGFAAAADFRAADAESFGTLTRTPVSFGYVDKETDLRASLPLIQLSPSGRVRGVRFNNRSMRPLRRPYAEITDDARAGRRLRDASVRGRRRGGAPLGRRGQGSRGHRASVRALRGLAQGSAQAGPLSSEVCGRAR